ncbi:hypothetical protein Dda_6761 [Drechslerella dactyloides]|uniref:Uncharacterized protein n=1 Tax=Drechslerella dactyloides TaxID=74499 RepID=A0AAD6IUI1_DREDA|nr:hypothetical protein Dda_6761 [Drechslerella dactyloides]
MPFVPELVSTTRYSNRNADASSSGSSKVDGSPADSAHVSKPRFLPEPIEVTRRSNRAAPASPDSPLDSSSSNSSTPKAILPKSNTADTLALSASQKLSRFLPEPVETSKRSNRTQAVKASSSNRKGWGRDSDDDYQAERKGGQSNGSDKTPAAAMSLNLAHQHRIPPGKSKWIPVDDESTRWGQQSYYYRPRHQAAAAGDVADARAGCAVGNRIQSPSQHPPNEDSNVNVNDANPAAAIGDEPPTTSPDSKQSASLPEEATSIPSVTADSGDPRQFNHSPNEVAGILTSTVTSNRASSANAVCFGVEEGAEPASLSSSPSSLKSNASGTNYLLSHCSIAIPSTVNHTQIPHSPSRDPTVVLARTSSAEEPPSISSAGAPHAGVKRPISPGTVLARDFAYPSILTRKLPKADASACSPCPTTQAVPKAQTRTAVEIVQRTVSGLPHTNNQPSPLGLTSANFNPSTALDHTALTTASKLPTAADLRDQVLAAQSQLIKDRQGLLTPTYTPSTKHLAHQQQQQHQRTPKQPHLNLPPSKFQVVPPPNGSDEPKRKRPLLPFSFIPAAPRPMNSPLSNGLLSPRLIPAATPLLCESPMPTTLYYESSKSHGSGDYFTSKKEKQPSAMSISSNSSALSRDTALTTPSTRPSSPGPLKYGYPSTSTSSLVQMMCQTPPSEHLLVADPPNMCPSRRCEVSPEFVVAVFNYLSLGHESIARKFDKELCQATGWGLERVMTDRLGALREYVEEYVDRKPSFSSGIGGW